MDLFTITSHIPSEADRNLSLEDYRRLGVKAAIEGAESHPACRTWQRRSATKAISRSMVLLAGHYAYYGVAGNLRALIKVYQVVERYWRRMLCSRSRDGGRLTWGTFNQIKERNPLLRPKLRLPHRELQALAVL